MDQSQSGARPLSSVMVRARDEDFRIVQVQGNLFICAKANGGCCCGWEEKGRAPINQALFEAEWQRHRLRSSIHLTFTACLGPCAVGNSMLLQIHGQSIWLKDFNDEARVADLFAYIAAMVEAGAPLPAPPALAPHIYDRYLPAAADGAPAAEGDRAGLERLDPVCLMDVDPATAPASLEYGGRVWYFCAPGCKKAFERDPQAYHAG